MMTIVIITTKLFKKIYTKFGNCYDLFCKKKLQLLSIKKYRLDRSISVKNFKVYVAKKKKIYLKNA